MRALRWAGLALLWLPALAHAGTRVDINRDWSFRIAGAADGVEAGWPREIPAGTTSVDLPKIIPQLS